jgi:uncharacterized protein YciI
MGKQYYFVKLIGPRPTFPQDITEPERRIMKEHLDYWMDFMNKGVVMVFGPVFDPKGVFGAGVIGVDSEEEVKVFIANDPANGLNSFEYHPMRAVVAQNKR